MHGTIFDSSSNGLLASGPIELCSPIVGSQPVLGPNHCVGPPDGETMLLSPKGRGGKRKLQETDADGNSQWEIFSSVTALAVQVYKPVNKQEVRVVYRIRLCKNPQLVNTRHQKSYSFNKYGEEDAWSRARRAYHHINAMGRLPSDFSMPTAPNTSRKVGSYPVAPPQQACTTLPTPPYNWETEIDKTEGKKRSLFSWTSPVHTLDELVKSRARPRDPRLACRSPLATGDHQVLLAGLAQPLRRYAYAVPASGSSLCLQHFHIGDAVAFATPECGIFQVSDQLACFESHTPTVIEDVCLPLWNVPQAAEFGSCDAGDVTPSTDTGPESPHNFSVASSDVENELSESEAELVPWPPSTQETAVEWRLGTILQHESDLRLMLANVLRPPDSPETPKVAVEGGRPKRKADRTLQSLPKRGRLSDVAEVAVSVLACTGSDEPEPTRPAAGSWKLGSLPVPIPRRRPIAAVGGDAS
ncbi:MAG: uncharacterized protein KVP18_003408 [Porospora cf. gigantea A]|uniref:uncharacterized protein n=1 Tax=Porospora cf. gigantea A TaxID=2853593 RepID=UPI003559477F|nr:MAG: hypothetical protein KVP18_003408 [Porospora cf. gigantea A]